MNKLLLIILFSLLIACNRQEKNTEKANTIILSPIESDKTYKVIGTLYTNTISKFSLDGKEILFQEIDYMKKASSKIIPLNTHITISAKVNQIDNSKNTNHHKQNKKPSFINLPRYFATIESTNQTKYKIASTLPTGLLEEVTKAP